MLIKCPECRECISDKAKACPHCGLPLQFAKQDTTEQKPERIIPPEYNEKPFITRDGFLDSGTVARHRFNSQHKQCPQCREYVKKEKPECPHCGRSLVGVDDIAASTHKFVQNIEALRSKCPVCRGTLERMDAGGRGRAFAEGNFFGAFAHTHRCSHCGHLV